MVLRCKQKLLSERFRSCSRRTPECTARDVFKQTPWLPLSPSWMACTQRPVHSVLYTASCTQGASLMHHAASRMAVAGGCCVDSDATQGRACRQLGIVVCRPTNRRRVGDSRAKPRKHSWQFHDAIVVLMLNLESGAGFAKRPSTLRACACHRQHHAPPCMCHITVTRHRRYSSNGSSSCERSSEVHVTVLAKRVATMCVYTVCTQCVHSMCVSAYGCARA